MPSRGKPVRCLNDSGSTLYLVAASMVFILATCGMAVDLVALYTARSEAQRAADAAALAGATMFVSSGCTGGASGVSCTAVQSSVISQAEAVGNTNFVGGQSPGIADTDVTFPTDSTNGGNPRVTVNVRQTIPTFFMKIFGITSENVSATATAEAYNPSLAGAGAATICEGCLKPIIVPNCDPNLNYTTYPNTNCSPSTYFIDPTSYAVEHQGVFPNGPIGEEWTLSSMPPASCGDVYPCSQYYEMDLSGPGYDTNITSCGAATATCGDSFTVLGPETDASASWRSLIHQGTPSDCTASPPGSGQDTIGPNPVNTIPPYVVTAGSSNPTGLQGVISSSDSIVTVPVYAGGAVNPGDKPAIVGFMQLFIEYACHSASGSDNLRSMILNLTGCANNSGGCSNGSAVSGGGASTIPVRLVQPG